ncbi:MAG TPA: glutamate--tRNA ligase [Geminicoccaceae bacterium]|nr:glutamate--tRNA ligase [Geminicoccaceae bacterium]
MGRSVSTMSVVTRFAPSPTGFLHLGGARTALFNWLYARHHRGRYLLRIEDTDRARSTQAAIDAILDGLRWLELDADEPPIFQSAHLARHAEIARLLLSEGRAYRCYCTPEELEARRARARAEGRTTGYDGRCRDLALADAPKAVAPVIRLKAPRQGETVIEDAVQGTVRFSNSQLDDMVLLRSDGTPTYMLSVVVDDHDMRVSHIIRGDDHLVNAARQTQLYHALGWPVPTFAHIPLIHGADGAKLSKRHGAVGIEAYRDQGFLPEAMRNYLLRLGWSHGDDEIIATEQAIAWFDLDGINKGAARFDLARLTNLNAHYLRQTDAHRLVALIVPLLEAEGCVVDEAGRARLGAGMPGLKPRATTLVDLAASAKFYVAARPLALSEQAIKLLDAGARARLEGLRPALEAIEVWNEQALEEAVRHYAQTADVKLGQVAQPLRAALTGSTASPGLFEVMAVLGQAETLARLADAIAGRTPGPDLRGERRTFAEGRTSDTR